VLIIMADDCTYNDLPLYGGKNARTPNIDRFARGGLTFNRAYLSEAMCQPSRAELFTGQYPMRNGCAWNHSACRPDVKSLPHYLGGLGYHVGLAGKVHVKPAEAFPFEKVGGFDPNCVRDPTRPHETEGMDAFMKRDDEAPFCLVVALVEPHVPWVMGDASEYPPDKLELPPNIADTETTREAFSRYLAEITYMDGQVGDILAALEKSGKCEDTLVLFTSEQGSQFPGCKWTNWDTGVHTALIAKWPGTISPDRRTDALVQYADIAPTLVEAAGGEVSEHPFDGKSFLPLLQGKSETTTREYAYGVHNNIPEGPAYPVRTVSDGEYRYVRNLQPEELYIEKHLMGWTGKGKLNNPYWATWVRESWQNAATYDLVKRYQQRPAEELYHTAKDPYEMTNLADGKRAAVIKARLSAELDRWMASQGDPGVAQDTKEAIQAARRGEHLHGPTSFR
jgi:N-sulfoglucosamine sulfohydrolase